MTTAGDVALKEHIERMISAEMTTVRTLIAHESKLREEWAKANDRALELQATENERRFTILNGERERERTDRQSYITREEYALAHKALEAMAQDTKERLMKVEASGAGMWKLVTVFAAVVSLVMGVILLAERLGVVK
jgi:hypothetical protein